jgi:predicted nuclease with RNAse H fold
LDLAASQTRPTGFCKLVSLKAKTRVLCTDEEILSETVRCKPGVVAVDAPLSLPPGRKTIEDRSGEHLRASDRELLRRKIPFFPITLGPMRKLTNRGIKLRQLLEKEGFTVIEVYPGGAQDVLGIPRKQQGLDKLRAGLQQLGITGINGSENDHELDAVTCAYVGRLFLDGKSVPYGLTEDTIVMPPGDVKKKAGSN